jgi:hypothetical protein
LHFAERDNSPTAPRLLKYGPETHSSANPDARPRKF